MAASRTLARWSCYAPGERGGFGTLCYRATLRQRRSIGRLSASVCFISLDWLVSGMTVNA